ncbi:hypothetical protein ACUXVY_03670 [Chromobacterium haemolyticum]|uniref:hypothetical protein n=1 Tax=Chromobacterium haemolyticum TaxID=394935 RepID=UPI004057BA74
MTNLLLCCGAGLDPLTQPLILRCADLSYDLYCLRRRALAQVLCVVLLAAFSLAGLNSLGSDQKTVNFIFDFIKNLLRHWPALSGAGAAQASAGEGESR